MRRLYVTDLATWKSHLHLMPPSVVYWLALYDPAQPGADAAWEAHGKPVVVTIDFTDERSQDLWEDHPEVTVLPHPVHDQHLPLRHTKTMPENVANLKDHAQHLLGHDNFELTGSSTVSDVHSEMAKWHPGFKMRRR